MNKQLMTLAFVAMIGTASATAADRKTGGACKVSAFVFSKLTVASLSYNFPDADNVKRPLALFAYTAKHFCGNGPASHWPGSRDGAMAFYGEVKSQGREAVCGRIYRELISSVEQPK